MNDPVTSPPKSIVVAHAEMASGLVSAVAAITGRADLFVAMSNAGLGSAEIAAKLVQLVDDNHSHVVYTDLPMGSCSMAAHRLLRERPDIIVVTGVNLPMLLHAATHEGESPVEVAESAALRGKEAVRAVQSTALKEKKEPIAGAD